jgi:hypothetical protein
MLETLENREVFVTDADCPFDRTLLMASEPDERGYRVGFFHVPQSPHSWVTWMIHPEGYTFEGYYRRTRGSALSDYLSRCEKEGVEA